MNAAIVKTACALELLGCFMLEMAQYENNCVTIPQIWFCLFMPTEKWHRRDSPINYNNLGKINFIWLNRQT